MNDPRRTVANFLERLAAKWKYDYLFLDSQGHCSLRTDDDLDVFLEVKERSNELFFIADLGTGLTELQAAPLLHHNLVPDEIRMATFCREITQGIVFLRYHYPIEALSEEVLGSLIGNFVEVSRWARELVRALADGKRDDLPIYRSKPHREAAPSTSAKLLQGRRRP